MRWAGWLTGAAVALIFLWCVFVIVAHQLRWFD
jgi:hypothetical protein